MPSGDKAPGAPWTGPVPTIISRTAERPDSRLRRMGHGRCTQALALAEAHGAPVRRAIAELHVALSEMDIDVGDLESAEHHLVTAAALPDLPMGESRHRWFVAKDSSPGPAAMRRKRSRS